VQYRWNEKRGTRRERLSRYVLHSVYIPITNPTIIFEISSTSSSSLWVVVKITFQSGCALVYALAITVWIISRHCMTLELTRIQGVLSVCFEAYGTTRLEKAWWQSLRVGPITHYSSVPLRETDSYHTCNALKWMVLLEESGSAISSELPLCQM